MSEENPTSVSNAQPVDGSAVDGGIKDSVSYETHLKLLNQRKADQARSQEMAAKLAEFEAGKKATEEADLLKAKNFEELLARKDQELNEANGRLGEVSNTIIRAEKLEAFQTALGGELAHSDFRKMINLDSISYGEDGILDTESLSAEVNRVRETYGDSILKKTTLPVIPGGAPGQTLPKTYAQLSAADKAAVRKAAVAKL